MPQVVLIDDDPLITEPLVRALGKEGYATHVAHDGQRGLELVLQQQPDVVILDVLMPEMNGWEVCRELRRHSPVPILMLTALGDEVDRVLGLELGADDYLTKPFSTRELLARLHALLRRVDLDRNYRETEEELSVGRVTVNLLTRRVFKDGDELTLRYKEFELLSLLMSRAGEVVTRAELFDKIWGTDWLGDTRTLDVHIRWLREKIEDDPGDPRYIQTVRGVGYRYANLDSGKTAA